MAARKVSKAIASPSRRFEGLYAHGFVRVAAGAPLVRPADPSANAAAILELAQKAHESGAALLLSPELGLSGYAIDDLLLQDALLASVEDAIARLKAASAQLFPVIVVGAPLRQGGALYNCAVAIHRGEILGVVPKTYLPNYREFYEKRHFASAHDAGEDIIRVCGQDEFFGANLVFAAEDVQDFAFHIEICEDFWAPAPPSTMGALAGATVLLNLSASNVTIGKAEDRKILCDSQSRRCTAAYVFAAAGAGESTTDLAWDGQVVAYELGELLGETERFARTPQLLTVDIHVRKIAQERRRLSSFRDSAAHAKEAIGRFDTQSFRLGPAPALARLRRAIARLPFAPDDPDRRARDCYEAYNIQVAGLAQRLEATTIKRAVIGVSGGLDSTHALIVAARAFDLLERPRSDIVAVTMPGFATSAATKAHAWSLMRALGADAREVSIEPLAQLMLSELGHPAARGEAVYDITYENVQAGLRTDFLFRLANKENALVIGTGDLSELALGWCTYGVGDHMSHYNVNAGAPKTLIKNLIAWVADEGLFDEETCQTLRAVLATEISPELVPGAALQSTEAVIGPYDVQDFNLYWISRFGLAPSDVLYLAREAWRGVYTYEELRNWLKLFLHRFFATSQFKRSAMPNGPKIVSGGALSPRGDWRAPSDASAQTWLDELARNSPETLEE